MKIQTAEFLKSCTTVEDCPTNDFSEIAFVGRSNVGKSSLLNCLLQQKGLAKVSRTPGKTQLINFFKVTFDSHPPIPFYMVDLPGYGYAKVSAAQRAMWGGSVEDYLTHRPVLRCLIVLFDIRREPSPLDRQLLLWLDHHRIPYGLVATKSDQVSRGDRTAALRAIKEALSPSPAAQDILLFSSKTGEGREALLQKIVQVLRRDF